MKRLPPVIPTLRSGFLTAWMQTPPGTDSTMFVNQPEKASMAAALKHIGFAREHGIQVLELAAAHAPRSANVPPESLADPVAHHANLETYRDGTGRDMSHDSITELVEACAGEVEIGTLGGFENMLHLNLNDRRQNLEHARRLIRAASLMQIRGLGTEGVTIFVGRDLTRTIEENMKLFAQVIVPLVRYAQQHNVKVFIENCPMCGWSSSHEVFTQNIANNVLHWILMARMIEAAGLKGWCFINYDPSHDILQGTRPEWSFKLMRFAGYSWFIGRFHGKDLSKQTGLLAMSGALGQRVAGGPWSKMNGDQPLPGATEHNPLAMANGLQVDWLGMLISARLDLLMDMDKVVFTTEFEQSEFRQTSQFVSQNAHWEVAGKLLSSSVCYIQALDRAAGAHASMHSLVAHHNRTWSWQPLNPNSSPMFNTGAEAVFEQAMAWEMPTLPTTSDLRLY